MADTYTTTTSVTEIVASEVISEMVGQSVRNAAIAVPLCKTIDIGAQPTLVSAAPYVSSLSVASVAQDAVQDASEFLLAESTATAAEYSVVVSAADLVSQSTTSDLFALIADEGGRAAAAQMDTSYLALNSGYTSAVGSTGVNLSNANILLAISNLQTNALADAADGVFVLPPISLHDLRAENTIGTSAALSTGFARNDLLDIFKANDGMRIAMAGELYGIPTMVHSLCPTANSGADRYGALTVRGMAAHLAVKWMPRVEMQREVNNGRMGTKVIISVAFGVSEHRDSHGVSILADA